MNKPVLYKVAAKAGIYEKEIKPYTKGVSVTGNAIGAGIGGILGYLTNKYLLGNEDTGSAVVASLGGALAGASLYTANEILSERRRIKENAGLPPEQQVNEDGTPVVKPEPGRIDVFSGVLTGGAGAAGGLGGYKAATKLFDRYKYEKPMADLEKSLADVRETLKLTNLDKAGVADANKELRRLLQNKQALERIKKRDAHALKINLQKRPGQKPRIKFHTGSKARLGWGAAGGVSGALLSSGATYALTNPRSREWIGDQVDSIFSKSE